MPHNYIDIIDIENLTLPENLLPPLEDTNSIEEYTKNAFDKLLNKEKHDLNFQTKNSHSQMTEDQQKYLKTLLFEWLILDFQPLHLLKSPSFCQFINALNENFELTTDREFQKRIFEAYGFSKNKLKQEITLAIQYLEYPHTRDAIQQVLEKIITQCELQHKVFFCTTDNASNMKKCLTKIVWLHRLSCTAHTIQLVVGKGAITDVETWWSNTYLAWKKLIALKPYIDIVISSLNVSKDNNAKEDVKRLNKINLTNNEWIYLKFWTNDENHQFEEVDEDDEPDARLLDNIKSNLYKALENYFEVIEKEALIAALLDPCKKKTMFANNDQKELAKANLCEVYELTENNEVEQYLVMVQIKNDQDPLKWWDVNKSQFLILAQLARKTSMKEDLFEALIYLKRNGNLVGADKMFS
ncbi:ribonuclease H-like domain-containing protein [Rhizophagus diaphanus]|nr:ribonuclease H-like domain-containing protein [Rhizophagus diaphanus] [Rhizophagus sp. MUCL 43196]